MIHLHGMVSAGMFTLSLSQPHALSGFSKRVLNIVQTMSRPLQLRTSEKDACFSWWWLSTFSNGGNCEVFNNCIDYAIVRWTCCRPLWDENMMNCYVRKDPWTGVRLSSRCRRHCGCRFDGFEGLVICFFDVCITIPVCSLGGRCCAVRGISFLYFQSLSCRPRNVR